MVLPLTRKLFLLLGTNAQEMIEASIAEGTDRDGKPYSYSTKPFARPLGGLNSTQRKRLLLKRNTTGADPAVQVFTARSGALWAVFKNGYRSFKEIAYQRPGGGNFLQASGDMLRAMNVIGATDSSATIGFMDAEAARKAFWLNVSGAGRSRSTWKFMGLRPDQQAALAELAAERIAPETSRDVAAELQKVLQTAIDARSTSD